LIEGGPMRLLITGGLGFIGSNFIRDAIERWATAEIINLDSMSYGSNPHNLNGIEDTGRYRFVKADVSDMENVREWVAKADVVVNFAAETHVDRSISQPESFLRSNVVGTFTLLEAARRSDVEKFVHISTDEVYGSAPSNAGFRESDRFLASSPYSASKAGADVFVEAYHKTYGLKTVTLRSTNNFGPYQFPEKFIPKIVISAILGRKVPIYGSGMQVRDWIYVADFCKAIELAIERVEPGATYNVSAGNEMPNLDVARQILQVLGKPIDLIQLVEDRPGHDFRYSLDSSSLRRDLGWKPEHIFPEALRETADWYVKNDWWWKPLISDKLLSPAPWKERW